MNKKSIIILLVLSLMVSAFLIGCTPKEEKPETPPAAGEETPEGEEGEEPEEGEESTAPETADGQIIIGNTTELTGDWVPYWTNNASDYEIYTFITGMSTVDMTHEGEYLINETVVTKSDVVENEDKSKTYNFTIKEDLKYADGTEITAKDYVASIMMWSSKAVQDGGGKPDAGYKLKGYEEFNSGTSKEFTGVNLISDTEFALTIAAENLPYFYELPAVSASPLNIEFWTDATVEIKDDGKGAYFSDNFTVENFGERFNVARNEVENFPSTGPYKLVSYDKSARTAVLEANENFPGNFEGQKPKIKTVIYKKVTSETALNELETGGIDILPQMASGDEINAGLDLVEKGGFDYDDYARAGYGKLVFQTDFGPTADVAVRQAIAHLIDRNDFAKAFTGGFGTVVNGPYGESMWFYQETKADLNEALNQYAYSLEDAKNLLVEAGWVLDEAGGEYKEGIRYKKGEDGKLMPLIIEWASTEQNAVSDLLVVKLQENKDVKEVGMEIKQTVMSFDELLLYMYRDGSNDKKYGVPTYGMYNLATNYTPAYDLSTTYTTDPEMVKAGYNTNFLLDEELEAAAKAMVLLDPEDKDAYKANFVKFVTRWNELLPDIPLYSNIYHDFFNEKLKNYDKNALIRVSDAILYAHVDAK
nr:ABC transporter substrate-binding protein [Tissierella sp.]